jgi:Ser-tRNA(Ala) deacylase AlaX
MAASFNPSHEMQLENSPAKLLLSTNHLYYNDTYLFSCSAKIIAIHEGVEDNRLVIILDQTVMHPQGGGQPTDIGIISSCDGKIQFKVNHVQKPRDASYIEHVGDYATNEVFSIGQEVVVEIDGERRTTNARIHSGGHLLDSALVNIGLTDLVPSKGYHFPDGPYVEYIGDVPADKRQQVIGMLNVEVERLINVRYNELQ